MKNGSITDFLDQLNYGGELVFEYEGKKDFKRSTKHGNHCKYTLFRQGW